MKQGYILMILFLIIGNILKGQDYHLFTFEAETIFELQNHNAINCISNDCHFNSTTTNKLLIGQDTLYVFGKTYKGITNFVNQLGNSCLTFADTSLFGQKLTIKNDFTFVFVNEDNDNIFIKPQKNLNDIWVAYQYQNSDYVEAKVVEVKLENVLNSTDTVKTIQFTKKDNLGNTISNPINSVELKVSRRFGLVSSPSFLGFPKDTSSLELVSHSTLNTSFRNIKWKEIYDFNVGDEHQIHDYLTGTPYYSDTYEKRIILTKDSTNLSWIYTIDREKYTENYLGDSIYTRDTLTEIYPFYHYSDTVKLKEMFNCSNNLIECNGIHWTLNRSNSYQKIMKKVKSSLYDSHRVADTCLVFLLGSAVPDTFYLKRLGGGYYHAQGSGSYHGRVLTYYKQGTNNWGNPVDFGLYNKTLKQLRESSKLEIFPNPSIEEVNVKTTDLIKDGKLTILEITGKVIYEEQLDFLPKNAIHKIKIDNFNSGIYIIRISTENVTWQSKLIKN